jgi:hypothetical protein
MLVEAVDGRALLVGQALYMAAEWAGSDDPSVSGLRRRAGIRPPTAPLASARRSAPDRFMFGHDLAVVRSVIPNR